MENSESTTVLVDYYKGKDGPILRIDIYECKYLIALIRAVNSLMRNRINGISLRDIFPVKYNNVSDVHLGYQEGNGMMRKSIFCSMSDYFLWITTYDGWYQNIGLLGGLLRGHDGGHQYFGEDSSDDAIIEVSYKEE